MSESRFEYEVRGHSRFPLDMLRYDRAYPASERDSAVIMGTLWPEVPSGPSAVRVVSAHHPTERRWESFGWRVASLVEVKHVGTVREKRITHMTPWTLPI